MGNTDTAQSHTSHIRSLTQQNTRTVNKLLTVLEPDISTLSLPKKDKIPEKILHVKKQTQIILTKVIQTCHSRKSAGLNNKPSNWDIVLLLLVRHLVFLR